MSDKLTLDDLKKFREHIENDQKNYKVVDSIIISNETWLNLREIFRRHETGKAEFTEAWRTFSDNLPEDLINSDFENVCNALDKLGL